MLRYTRMTQNGMNGVAVAQNGPILWENDGTGSRKVFRCFLGFRDTILTAKLSEKVPKPLYSKNQHFYYITPDIPL